MRYSPGDRPQTRNSPVSGVWNIAPMTASSSGHGRLQTPVDVAHLHRLHGGAGHRLTVLVDHPAGDRRATRQREVDPLDDLSVAHFDRPTHFVGPRLAMADRDEAGLRRSDRESASRKVGNLVSAGQIGLDAARLAQLRCRDAHSGTAQRAAIVRGQHDPANFCRAVCLRRLDPGGAMDVEAGREWSRPAPCRPEPGLPLASPTKERTPREGGILATSTAPCCLVD